MCKTKTPEYTAWQNMKQRCLNPNHPLRKWYSEKGVKIAPEWLVFEQFLKDVGPKPTGTYLDRIDSNGNYEPGNVRWATKQQHLLNRSFVKGACARGVRQWKNGRYCARIKRGGIEYHIGYFDTEEEAVSARQAWERDNDY